MTDRHAAWEFACPRCRGLLQHTAADALYCAADNLYYRRIEGIWRFLLPERDAFFEKFRHDYETIRKGEGRGSQDAAYYRALPYPDRSSPMRADWRIRAASFDALLKRVIQPAGDGLFILDLGAGNGWLSNRLAERGHSVAAVDLLTNDFDGLGCQRFFASGFTPVQAEFNQLPFADRAVDMVIFNASLHYSIDILKTLAEALRVLKPSGKIVLLDSPVYRDARSGEKMVEERERQFARRFGFPSNALPSQNFLTYAMLQSFEKACGIQWQIHTPFYGIAWLLKPVKARILGSREPAKFHLIIGSRTKRG